ncbi:chemotaxis protein CheB [Marilutibacter alkalisoli]|uniref:CheB-type methylesterase domain-containing protein n=1 Tax=Marilutibacter alkalisoli TaxID=2591633 RepID=A0A514BTY7_9GAMM|nr:chemotaxis protein CheB [Lysobacter alkalisoli]QDH70807.1 hypothetical protein FKV23_12490 [Lysobacter alkalisoli]
MTDYRNEPAPRVALLVRPGIAGERLRELLAEAGIESVLHGDPNELPAEALSEARPEIVLVALDPDMENALERFESVLGNPGVNVIYEEAELAAAREGWEAARWKRHLLAKLQGHDRVLPPRPDNAAEEPAGLRVHSAPEISDEALAAFDPNAGEDDVAIDTQVPAHEPSARFESEAPAADVMELAEGGISLDFDVDIGIDAEASPDNGSDGDGITLELEDEDAGGQTLMETIESDEAGEGSGGFEINFDPVAAETVDVDVASELEFGDDAAGDFEIIFDGTATTADATPSPGLDEHLDSLSSIAQDKDHGAAEPPPLPVAEVPAEEGAGPSTPATDTGFGELTLDDGSGAYWTAGSQSGDAGFGHDLSDLDARIASLELVDDAPVEHIPGAVLVMAGIGGPDAVRQLLGALPNDFPRPVLVQQRLDGGRYDRLVAQMQRATTLPVQLAEPGRMVMAGFVYVVPAGVGIEAGANGMNFSADGDILAGLPSADSGVLMLSGSDPDSIDIVLKHRVDGALVVGQSPEGCYDPAAPGQLAARGGELAPPVELAQRLAERWPA